MKDVGDTVFINIRELYRVKGKELKYSYIRITLVQDTVCCDLYSNADELVGMDCEPYTIVDIDGESVLLMNDNESVSPKYVKLTRDEFDCASFF